MQPRIIVTFASLHQVLTAEKALRTAASAVFKIRPTPTPPELSTSVCGMSIEILEEDQKQTIIDYLQSKSIKPSGLYTID